MKNLITWTKVQKNTIIRKCFSHTYTGLLLLFGFLVFLLSCKDTVPSMSIDQKDQVEKGFTYKRTALSKELLESWPLMDMFTDSIPGISLEKAKKVVEGQKGQPVLVAVIDAGVEIDHSALHGMIWENEDELPNNALDDDRNGKIDDMVGWNFLGETSFAPFAITRIVANVEQQLIDGANIRSEEEDDQYLVIKKLYDERTIKVNEAYEQLAGLYNSGEKGPIIEPLYNGRRRQKEYHYNPSFNPREVIGDDPKNINDSDYGDNNVLPRRPGEMHGTHVMGIIVNVTKKFNTDFKMMPIRAIPKGDEYDKDVALAIRYAVDNGAGVINMSFGKPYSEYSEWVYEAIEYAAKKDVLLVHGAGNDAFDLDTVMVYPNDHKGSGLEFVSNYLNVGASTRFYNKKLVAPFSNYGKRNVDIFAPGVAIYSAVLGDGYDYNNGTSMAAPLVAGVAAVIRSYHPGLSAAEVKQILMTSGLEVPFEVVVPGKVIETTPFKELCKSGRILNAYNALKMADDISKKQNETN